MATKRPTFWPVSVKRLFVNSVCVICGSNYRICIDHIVPLAKGGTNELTNLQPLCQPCNLKKGGRLTNSEMIYWYLENKQVIDADRRRREANKYKNSYDWI